MAAPTQEYPPWLTVVPTVLTGANGAPLTTVTEIVYLPLTYYGPSIPLGPYWTYGGLTSPALSTSSTHSSTATGPSTTTHVTPSTATPSSSASFSSSNATPTSSASVTSSSSSPSAPSPSSPAPEGHSLGHSQLVGIVVASVLGFLFLLLFALLLCLCCKGRRRQKDPPFTWTNRSGLLSRFEFVNYDGPPEGEGVPRQSGGEADPFLQRRSLLPPPPAETEVGGRPQARPGARVPAQDTRNSRSSGGSRGTNSTNASGYGNVIPSTLNLQPGTRKELELNRRGPILSPDELDALVEEPSQEMKYPDDFAIPPLPPALPRSQPPSIKHHSSQYSFNPYTTDEDEHPTVLTARRVRVDDFGSRTAHWLPASLASSSRRRSKGILDAIRRFSLFKPSESGSGRNSRPPSAPTGADDVEVGTLSVDPDMGEKRTLAKGLGLDSDRPLSTISAQSGATVFFDAYSSFSSTLPPVGPSSSPLPRALTPSGAGAPPRVPSNSYPSHGAAHVPPTSADPPEYSVHEESAEIPNVNHGLPSGYDVLDVPVPVPVSHFSSGLSTPSLQTRSITSGSGSASIATYPLPPGLAFVPSKIWTDTSSGNPFHVPGVERSISVPIDVLEEEPPTAGESWKNLAESTGVAKRATFGQRSPSGMQVHHVPSDDSFIESMRSPPRSTGSAPASRRDFGYGSFGTASSHRTAAGSLNHSGSISSDARRRNRSPTFSAFGGHSGGGSMGSSVLLAPPTAVHFENERPRLVALSTGSRSQQVSGSASPEPRSPLSPSLLSAPWVTGLDNDWTPA